MSGVLGRLPYSACCYSPRRQKTELTRCVSAWRVLRFTFRPRTEHEMARTSTVAWSASKTHDVARGYVSPMVTTTSWRQPSSESFTTRSDVAFPSTSTRTTLRVTPFGLSTAMA